MRKEELHVAHDTSVPQAETKKKRRRKKKDPEGRMALNEHLTELRNRLVITALTIVVAAVVGWIFYNQIVGVLQQPFDRIKNNPNINANISFGQVGSTLNVKLQISAYVGVILAFPMMLYQSWMFIMPGLHKNERRYALGFFGAAIPLFFAGCIAGFWVMDKAVPVLMGFAPHSQSVNVVQNIEFSGYLKLFIKTMLAFGCAFVLPVVLVLLNFVGILPGRTMLKAWRWVVFVCFAFTAMMVPTPDPFTMTFMALPMVGLYFAAVIISIQHDKRKAKREEDGLDDVEASTIDDAPEAVDGPSSLDEDENR